MRGMQAITERRNAALATIFRWLVAAGLILWAGMRGADWTVIAVLVWYHVRLESLAEAVDLLYRGAMAVGARVLGRSK